MDALNASTDVKRKVPKRTRRLSSREDSKEEKKPEPATTPTTPPATTSPVAAKPLLKVGPKPGRTGASCDANETGRANLP